MAGPDPIAPEPDAAPGELAFPPDLVPVLRQALGGHRALRDVPDSALRTLLGTIFFAAVTTEEHRHEAIHVAFVGRRHPTPERPPDGSRPVQSFRFRRPFPCRASHLLKLARASASQRLFTTACLLGDQLMITGMAPGPELAPDYAIAVVAPRPGRMEVWRGTQRVIEYARGQIRQAPDSVLRSKGPVRHALRGFADGADPDRYLELVVELVRRLGAHGHGGILVISCEDNPSIPEDEPFVVEGGIPLSQLLNEDRVAVQSTDEGHELLHEILRDEVERNVDDIGRTTALDGATILDRHLGLRGFGVLLPTAPDLRVVEAADPEGLRRQPLTRAHGARHRAAASHAWSHPGDVVFVASSDGGISCLLRLDTSGPVVLWPYEGRGARPGASASERGRRPDQT